MKNTKTYYEETSHDHFGHKLIGKHKIISHIFISLMNFYHLMVFNQISLFFFRLNVKSPGVLNFRLADVIYTIAQQYQIAPFSWPLFTHKSEFELLIISLIVQNFQILITKGFCTRHMCTYQPLLHIVKVISTLMQLYTTSLAKELIGPTITAP